jgi:hypothetical protein
LHFEAAQSARPNCAAPIVDHADTPLMKPLRPLLLLAVLVGATTFAAAQASKPAPGEPPEDVLIAIKTAEYEQINKAGGMPVTVTASGRSAVLRPKIWSAKKDAPCRAVPRHVDTFECSLNMMVTLREGDNKPGKHAERLYVHWDGTKGEWKRGMPGRKK